MNQDSQLEGIGTALGNAQSLSILKDAQKRRQERKSTLFLAVPSWDGELICEYRVVPPGDLAKIAEGAIRRARSSNGKPEEPAANDIAMIVAASVGLYVKNPENGEQVPIEDEFGHVGYDRIALVLGKQDQIKSNADAVRYLMSERDPDDQDEWVTNIMAISLHANAIGKWMKDPGSQNIDMEALLGEL
jgi:hypothetical protein